MPEANISTPPTADEKPDGQADDKPDGRRAGGAADKTGTDGETSVPDDEAVGEDEEASDEDPSRTGLTPRQARRVRIVVSGVVMAAVAVALVVRLGSAPSVLTVGFYGIALILSGTAGVLSRRGRTRVASGVLALGFGAVALAEWLLASVE